MNAIADCAKAIKEITSSNGAEEMQQLVELTKQAIHQHSTIANSFATPDSTTPSVPKVRMAIPTSTQSVPRVQGTDPAQRLTRWIAQSLELAKQQIGRALLRPTEKPTSTPPTQSTSTIPLSQKKHKQRRVAGAQATPKSTNLAANTRSKTKADAPPPPATRTHASMKNLGSAAEAVTIHNTMRKYVRGLTKKMEQIENKVHQAMAVMD
jgi:hypothetical protein